MSTLSAEELRRYSRHLLLPEVGLPGQERLRESSVLVVGAGGLGSPLAMYLAAAGVGRIGLVDFDLVEASNLQRQILHGESDVGRSKLDSAADSLSEINPFVEVEAFDTQLSSENALDILRGFDVVADGADNFPTRYLVNDASILTGVPNVYASIYRFDGQVSVFGARGGPCYRCLYPVPPPPELVPSCAEGGVLGVLPGIVGSLQAAEVLKLLLHVGKPLVGRLLLVDVLSNEFQEVSVFRNPSCPACGDSPTLTRLIDYDAFCGTSDPVDAPAISVSELRRREVSGEGPWLLDVRLPEEAEIASLGGTLIPLAELGTRIGELPSQGPIVVYCRTGARSARAVKMLRSSGLDAVNLAGGIRAWSEEIDPSVRIY